MVFIFFLCLFVILIYILMQAIHIHMLAHIRPHIHNNQTHNCSRISFQTMHIAQCTTAHRHRFIRAASFLINSSSLRCAIFYNSMLFFPLKKLRVNPCTYHVSVKHGWLRLKKIENANKFN